LIQNSELIRWHQYQYFHDLIIFDVDPEFN